jgi:hypothetical protein
VRFRLFGALRIRLDSGDQGRAFARCLQLAEHAQMIAPECAGAGYGNAYEGCARYFAASFSASLPSTAVRQRP